MPNPFARGRRDKKDDRVYPQTLPHADVPGARGATPPDTYFGIPWPTQYGEASEPGWGGYTEKQARERRPVIPEWAEYLGWAGAQPLFQELMQPRPTLSPYEQLGGDMAMQFLGPLLGQTSPYTEGAGQALLGLTEPSEPGGRAFAGLAEAIMPYLEQRRGRGREAMEEGLARSGMLRSGAGQELLGQYETETGQALAATLAPYAMQGEALGQQGILGAAGPLMGLAQQPYQTAGAALPYLMGLGQQQWQRPMQTSSQYIPALLGALRGGSIQQQPSAGFWDYAAPILGGAMQGWAGSWG